MPPPPPRTRAVTRSQLAATAQPSPEPELLGYSETQQLIDDKLDDFDLSHIPEEEEDVYIDPTTTQDPESTQDTQLTHPAPPVMTKKSKAKLLKDPVLVSAKKHRTGLDLSFLLYWKVEDDGAIVLDKGPLGLKAEDLMFNSAGSFKDYVNDNPNWIFRLVRRFMGRII
ncbi:hypothetical protein ABEF95_004994 [Exophiala dermatitidis]